MVITGQNEQKLARLAGKLPRDTTVIAVDLSKEENCRKLYDRLQALPLQLVINNAGIGVYGAFSDTSLEREMQMLGVNVAAVHILTKLFLQKFQAGRPRASVRIPSLQQGKPPSFSVTPTFHGSNRVASRNSKPYSQGFTRSSEGALQTYLPRVRQPSHHAAPHPLKNSNAVFCALFSTGFHSA